jgi:hypothetical protein
MAYSRFTERFRRAAFFALGSLLLFLVAETVNFNREAWLGVTPGYAPHNFSFNLSFYLPMMVVSNVLAFTAVVYYIRSLRAARKKGLRPRALEWMTVLPIIPVLYFDAMAVLFILWLVTGD